MTENTDSLSVATSNGVTALDGFTLAVSRSGQVQAELENLSDRIREVFLEFEASKFGEISERTKQLVQDLSALENSFTALNGEVNAASVEYQKITTVGKELAVWPHRYSR
jgi:predicted nuclease with TOPRIM domain